MFIFIFIFTADEDPTKIEVVPLQMIGVSSRQLYGASLPVYSVEIALSNTNMLSEIRSLLAHYCNFVKPGSWESSQVEKYKVLKKNCTILLSVVDEIRKQKNPPFCEPIPSDIRSILISLTEEDPELVAYYLGALEYKVRGYLFRINAFLHAAKKYAPKDTTGSKPATLYSHRESKERESEDSGGGEGTGEQQTGKRGSPETPDSDITHKGKRRNIAERKSEGPDDDDY